MRPHDMERQARAFLGYHGRRGGGWEESFEAWGDGKDFQPSDLRAIRRLVEAEMIAGGAAVITDLPYTPPRWPARSRAGRSR